MRKRHFTKLLFLLFLGYCQPVLSQCTSGSQFPSGTFTATTSYTSAATNSYAGEYVVWNVVQGSTYTWSTCSADGGVAAYDTELTLTNNTGGTVLGYSDDNCGTASKITWTATYNGTVRVYLHWVVCFIGCSHCNSDNLGLGGDNTVVCKVVHPPLPTCGAYVAPANTASVTAAGTTLDWNAAGGTVHGYRIYFGTNNPPTNIINGTDLGLVTSYATGTLTANTTYYWRVAPWNYGSGNQTGCSVMSFNTIVPTCATSPAPVNNATGISTVGTSLSWTAPASPPGTPTAYKLFFGTNNPPTNLINGTNIGNVTSYSVGTLSAGTDYYWKIVPTNAAGDASSCTVNKFTTSSGPASCSNILYVSSSGTGNGFDPTSPMSLADALTLISAGTYGQLNIVRMLSGTYTINSSSTSPLNNGRLVIPANTLFDGGYESVGTGCDATWRKNTSLTTTLNFTPVLETPTVSSTQIGVYRGVVASAVNNWRLQDLTINVLSGGATGQTNNRGRSVYGVHVDGCSGYELVRCKVLAGAASNGSVGTTPAAGGGSAGGAGGGGSNPCTNAHNQNCTTGAGAAGTAGGGVGSGTNANGGGAPSTRNSISCNAASSNCGSSGNAGTTGAAGNAGTNSTTTGSAGTYNTYYIPGGQGGTGGPGGGGQGGGGGSGSTNQARQNGFCVTCTNVKAGVAGGTGGAGGAGGTGGSGGYGGGASFGIYINGTTGTISGCNIASGTAGAGGLGAAGSNGTVGSAGVTPTGNGSSTNCLQGCSSINGGAGGTGGTGGKGGTGGAGAAGVSVLYATNSGAQTSPSVTVPVTAVTVKGWVGASNSEIEITRPAGTGDWALPAGASYVPDVSAGNSSYTNTSTTARIYFSALPGSGALPTSGGSRPAIYGLNLGYTTPATTFSKVIQLAATRSLPVINTISDVCIGSAITIGTTTSGTCYDWSFQQISTPNSTTSPGANLLSGGQLTAQNPGSFTPASTGTYQVKLRVKDDCYGWSIPVYQTVVVHQVPSLPATTTATICFNSAYNLTTLNPTDANSTTGSYTWSLTQGGTALGSTTVSLTTPGTFIYYVRKTTSTTPSCSDETEVTITVNPTPDLPASDAVSVCATATLFDLTAYTPSDANSTAGSIIWSATSGGSALGSTMVSAATPGTYTYYVRKVTATTPACSDETVFTLTVNANPSTPAITAQETSGTTNNDGIVCSGTNFTLSGPSGMASYAWSPAGGSSQVTTAQSLSGNTAYTLTVTNVSNCSASNTYTVTVNTTPGAPISGSNSPVCATGVILLNATGATGATYSWIQSSGPFTSSAQNPSISSATTGMSDNYCVIQTVSACPSAPSCTPVTVQATCGYVWAGAGTDDMWTTPGNWQGGVVPLNTCGSNVTIPTATPRNPVLAANVNVGDLTLGDGKNINTAGNSLSICGNWAGGITAVSSVSGTGQVKITGTAAQTISGKTQFETLHIDKSSGSVATQTGSTTQIYTALELKSGNLDNTSGNITLKSTATAHAIFNDFGSPYGSYSGTFTGSINAERYYEATSANSYNQHYIGSPVSNADLAQFGAGGSFGAVTPTGNCDETQLATGSVYGSVFSYNQANGSTCAMAGWYVEAAGSDALPGKGYSVAKTGPGTLTLTGTPNTASSYAQVGLINSGWSNTSLQSHSYVAGWQLVANPYNATLDLTGVAAQPGFDAQIKVWVTHGTGAGSYQDATVIAPFQAFFIKKNSSPGSTYTINGNKRVITPQTFQLQNNSEELTITATNNNTTLTDITTVAFNSDATGQFDADYDANKLSGSLSRHNLYSMNNGMWMSKNILHSIAETSTVDVGLEPGISGDYSFAFDGLNSFDPTSYITLEDKKLNTFFDVRAGNYSFTADATDNRDRFVLHFTPKAEITTTDQGCETPGAITITQPGTSSWTYTLTDNSNTVISTGTLNNSSNISATVPMGTYFLTLVDANNYTVIKTITVTGSQPDAATFTPSAATVEEDELVTFTSTTPNGAIYNWDFGDGTSDNSTLPDMEHHYQFAGTYTVTLTVTNAYGCHSTTSQVITVTQKVVSGLAGLDDKSGIVMWSSGNRVYINFKQLPRVNAQIDIYNVLGQQLVSEKYGRNSIYSKPLDISYAAYILVRVTNEGEVTTRKLFVAVK